VTGHSGRFRNRGRGNSALGDWNDLSSTLAALPGATRSPTRTTGIRVTTATSAGDRGRKKHQFPQPTYTTPAAPGNDFGTDGGVHNFLRYLENWSGQTMYYKGSMVSLFYATYNTGTFKCCTDVYGFSASVSTSTGLYVAGRPYHRGTPCSRCETLSYRQCLRHAPAANRRGHSVVHITPRSQRAGVYCWREQVAERVAFSHLAGHSRVAGGDVRRSTRGRESARLARRRMGSVPCRAAGSGGGALTAGSEAQQSARIFHVPAGCLTRTTRYFPPLFRGAFPWRRARASCSGRDRADIAHHFEAERFHLHIAQAGFEQRDQKFADGRQAANGGRLERIRVASAA